MDYISLCYMNYILYYINRRSSIKVEHRCCNAANLVKCGFECWPVLSIKDPLNRFLIEKLLIDCIITDNSFAIGVVHRGHSSTLTI